MRTLPTQRSSSSADERLLCASTLKHDTLAASRTACRQTDAHVTRRGRVGRHSGVDEVSVFVEVEDGLVSAYVRDEGTGFDPGAVPDDRRGIADSIIRRMELRGGTAEVRSEVGRGTEIVLRLPWPRR